MAESPASSLSSLTSEAFTEDVKMEDGEVSMDLDGASLPPTKRQRTSHMASWDSKAYSGRGDQENLPDMDDDISSDTSGDVPNSPTIGNSQLQDDEPMGHEQITVCRWDGCPAGDLGNMDNLVQHIHDDHIQARQKRYSCEWEDCNRKGMPHASGYALRAHMRSHTREKPFYCALPECDRSFTRSDALAKHMRTVHETEALRPSDPVPRNQLNPPKGFQRLKLVMSSKHAEHADRDDIEIDDDATVGSDTDGQAQTTFEYPPDVSFTEEEQAMPILELFRLLRRQVHWAEEESLKLKAECEALEARKKEEWQSKELLLDNLMEATLSYEERKGGLTVEDEKLRKHVVKYPLTGSTPWYRHSEDVQP